LMRSKPAYFTLIITVVTLASAQDSKFPPAEQQLPVPECLTMRGLWEGGSKTCTPNEHEAWLADITHWRNERRIRIGYNGSRYNLPALQWTQSSFIQPQMMVHDRYFYDPIAGKYTVDRYIDDLQKRYGGIDAVLIWPTYPNMGIDNRNQHDMIRSMPGGVSGVKQMIADFHRRGVRVLFPMMMWDQGTRDPGMPWPYAIATLMAEISADGINGDTQDGVPLAFTLAADEAGHPLAFEPEGGPSDEALAWNVMTWGQYQFPFTPLVDKYKWLEPRHMVNISDRWKRDKTDDLQFAFFNGVGWESWENIWGIWNGITPRDAEATRRIATIERAIAPFLVTFPIEAKGYGAVLATDTAPDQKIVSLMSTMKSVTATPLSTYSHEWKVLPQQIVPIQATKAATTIPVGMIKIPEADFTFRVSGIEIEGFNDDGVDVQYSWEDSPRRFHEHTIHVNSFYIDKFPVTNAEFKKFLDATRYHPKDDLNFLRDWKDGIYPSGWENKPVTWVSQEDARAYAAWAGKRLPHEWEWQYAAQGPDSRPYPWGNEWQPAAVPVPDRSRNMRGPDVVDAHSEGASPFGVMDLVGNVWQWTEEFVDEHTRAAIVRGGSYYQPQGSIWYFPQAYKLNEHGKLLLMSPSMDRSAALGFRCVADAR